MQLLVNLLPCQPLKLPQQRAWTAACCVTMLQQLCPGEERGEEACSAVAQKSGIQLYHCEMHPSQGGSVECTQHLAPALLPRVPKFFFMRDTLRANSAQGVSTTHTGAVACAGQSRGLAGGVVAGVLHLCFELTQHGDSIAAILPGLSAALQQEPALCAPLLPSLALLAQLSPQSTADDIMAEMLSLCSSLPSIPSSVRGVVPSSIYTAVCG